MVLVAVSADALRGRLEGAEPEEPRGDVSRVLGCASLVSDWAALGEPEALT